jgi:hypothetical protein
MRTEGQGQSWWKTQSQLGLFSSNSAIQILQSKRVLTALRMQDLVGSEDFKVISEERFERYLG